MIIVTMMTLIFQFLLNDIFTSLLQFMSLTEMRKEKRKLKYYETELDNHLWIMIWKYFTWLAWSKNSSSVNDMFFNMHDDMKNFTLNENDDLVSLAFQHASLCIQRSVVWISDDHLRISDDEMFHIKRHYSNVRITNEHASLDEKRRVIITQDSQELLKIKSMKLWSLSSQISANDWLILLIQSFIHLSCFLYFLMIDEREYLFWTSSLNQYLIETH